MIQGKWLVIALLSVAGAAQANITNASGSADGSFSIFGYDIGPGGSLVPVNGGGGLGSSGFVGNKIGASGMVSGSAFATTTTAGISFQGIAGPSGNTPGGSGSYQVSASETFKLPLDADVSISFSGSGAGLRSESFSGGPASDPFSYNPANQSGFISDMITPHLLAGTYTISGGASGFNGGGGLGEIDFTLVKEFAAVPEPSMSVLLAGPMLMLRRRRKIPKQSRVDVPRASRP